jgi:hypothetical protein
MSPAEVRHEAAMARREADAIREARAEEKRQCRAQKHGFHLSGYPREDADFYPTPPVLAAGLTIGLSRLGIKLPRTAVDPCGGDGALRRALSPSGIEVKLTDLYPEQHPTADGYLTREMLDAGHMESLRFSLELAGPDCRAIITNSPHNTEEAMAIIKNSIALAEGGRVDFAAALFKNIWGDEKGRISLSPGRHFSAKLPVAGAPDGSWEARGVRSTPILGSSGGMSRGTAYP